MSGCGSLYLFPSAAGGASLIMAEKALIYEHSRMSSGVISLQCSFSRTVLTPRSPTYVVRFVGPDGVRNGFYLMKWVSIQSDTG